MEPDLPSEKSSALNRNQRDGKMNICIKRKKNVGRFGQNG
jgi:hypothetical protein